MPGLRLLSFAIWVPPRRRPSLPAEAHTDPGGQACNHGVMSRFSTKEELLADATAARAKLEELLNTIPDSAKLDPIEAMRYE